MISLRLEEYLRNCIREGKIPGTVLWVGDDRRIYYFEALGNAQVIPKQIRVNKDTIFDLASITKPLCTAMAVMLLFEDKEIKLNDQVEKYLLEFKNSLTGKRTIKQLLTHTSGLPAWYPLYILPENKSIDYLRNAGTKDNKVVYSCLGYVILSIIIERITHLNLAEYCAKNIFKKLGLKNTFFNPPKEIKNIAPTELGNEHEKEKAKEFGDISKIRWRDYLIKGEVHDGNCFYAFNGVSGNAGLFSNAEDLSRILKAYLQGGIVRPGTLKMMIKDYTGGNEKRGLGWWVNPYPGILSDSAFGHTGFTGTMVMVEPKKNLIIILLANSVHPVVRLGIMPEIRRKVIQIIVSSLKQKKSKA
uniref:Class A beta-lactamase-related serine hydrolase n=1 Tax=candidate division WOR-3 bacterium TaxID=2052148 RepID=A0A7V1EIU5_UNCW3